MKVVSSLSSEERLFLLGLSDKELENIVIAEGQSPFRARQIYTSLYKHGVRSLDEIKVLPQLFRTTLYEKGIRIGYLSEVARQEAADKTLKLLLRTDDGETVESVGIPTPTRLTVCVSSQVGCPMGCRFCATGKGGLERSLAVHEIIGQVLSIRKAFDRRPSHIVFMGMGEPLLNIQVVLDAIRCLNQDLGIGQRRITVSTVGIVNTLPKFADLAIKQLGSAQFTLAVSLHAPNQKLREELIPSAKTYPISQLLEDCRYYIIKTGRRVSFEYILLGEINDHLKQAKELSALVSGFQSHVNLIAYNPIAEESFKRPTLKRIRAFKAVLEGNGIAVSLRASRGLDQNAACGQLRRHKKDS